jgi:hypothetical protein
MSKIDDEIEAARARVERLKEKKRADEAKKRARVAEAILSVLAEIVNNENENAEEVSVRTLIDRANAKIDAQNAKRKRAAAKAAARRREASSGATNGSGSQPVWGREQ